MRLILILVTALVAAMPLKVLTADNQAKVMVGDIEINPTDFNPANPDKVQIQSCLKCHGNNAGGDQDFSPPADFGTPSIQGLDKGYIIESLRAYQQGLRYQEEMQTIASLLSPEGLESIASIISALPVTPVISEPALSKVIDEQPIVQQGQMIAETGLPKQGVAPCASCHGKQGAGIKGLGPRLAGQNQTYIVKQLQQFQTGLRITSQALIMKNIIDNLNPEQRQAVGMYYQVLVDYQQQ